MKLMVIIVGSWRGRELDGYHGKVMERLKGDSYHGRDMGRSRR